MYAYIAKIDFVTADNAAEDCQQSVRQRISRLRP